MHYEKVSSGSQSHVLAPTPPSPGSGFPGQVSCNMGFYVCVFQYIKNYMSNPIYNSAAYGSASGKGKAITKAKR